jgi:hypothetical protein
MARSGDSRADSFGFLPDHVPDELVARYGKNAQRSVRYSKSTRRRLGPRGTLHLVRYDHGLLLVANEEGGAGPDGFARLAALSEHRCGREMGALQEIAVQRVRVQGRTGRDQCVNSRAIGSDGWSEPHLLVFRPQATR